MMPVCSGSSDDACAFAKTTLLALLEHEHARAGAALAAAAAGAGHVVDGGELRNSLCDTVGELALWLLGGDYDDGGGSGAPELEGCQCELPPLFLERARGESVTHHESGFELLAKLVSALTGDEPARRAGGTRASLAEVLAVLRAGLADARAATQRGGVVCLHALLWALGDSPPSACETLAPCVEPLLAQLFNGLTLRARPEVRRRRRRRRACGANAPS